MKEADYKRCLIDHCRRYLFDPVLVLHRIFELGWSLSMALDYKIFNIGELSSSNGICEMCGSRYKKKGPAKYCINCRKKKRLEGARRKREKDREICSYSRKKWEAKEDDIIYKHGKNMSLSDIQKLLSNRTRSAIKNRRLKLGIKTK
jgi:hypothetical protein